MKIIIFAFFALAVAAGFSVAQTIGPGASVASGSNAAVNAQTNSTTNSTY